MAETALSSEVFALGSSCDVVTSRKFVRFVGSAEAIDAPATAMENNVENFILRMLCVSSLVTRKRVKTSYEQEEGDIC